MAVLARDAAQPRGHGRAGRAEPIPTAPSRRWRGCRSFPSVPSPLPLLHPSLPAPTCSCQLTRRAGSARHHRHLRCPQGGPTQPPSPARPRPGPEHPWEPPAPGAAGLAGSRGELGARSAATAALPDGQCELTEQFSSSVQAVASPAAGNLWSRATGEFPDALLTVPIHPIPPSHGPGTPPWAALLGAAILAQALGEHAARALQPCQREDWEGRTLRADPFPGCG